MSHHAITFFGEVSIVMGIFPHKFEGLRSLYIIVYLFMRRGKHGGVIGTISFNLILIKKCIGIGYPQQRFL